MIAAVNARIRLCVWLSLLVLSGLCSPSLSRAQMIEVVATSMNGNPLDGGDLRFEFDRGERISLNVMLNTLNTDIHTGVVTVSLLYPAGAFTKIIRGPGDFFGTGWPIIDGIPMLADDKELPMDIWPHLGQPFFSVTSSADNPDCPCDENNGEGLESLIHFLVVDLPGDTWLPPGYYHVFQTDWIIEMDCSIEDITIDITDGPKDGLVGLSLPVTNFIVDEITEEVFNFQNGLEAFDASIEFDCNAPFRFIRGDVNVDSRFDQSDAVSLLLYLFLGHEILCIRAGDVDSSGLVDITDVIEVLTSFFLTGTNHILPPFPRCGFGVSDKSLDCQTVCSTR